MIKKMKMVPDYSSCDTTEYVKKKKNALTTVLVLGVSKDPAGFETWHFSFLTNI